MPAAAGVAAAGVVAAGVAAAEVRVLGQAPAGVRVSHSD